MREQSKTTNNNATHYYTEEIPEINDDFFQMEGESQDDNQQLSENDFKDAEQPEEVDIYQQKQMMYKISSAEIIEEDAEGEALESNLGTATARGRLPSSARMSVLKSSLIALRH